VLTSQTSVAFVATRHRAAVEAQLATMPGMQLRELALKTFQQEPVVGIYATHFRQLGRLARALQPQGIPVLEADVRPHDRYLMERFITAGVLVEGGRTDALGRRRRQAQARARVPSGAEGGVAGHRDQPARGAVLDCAGRHAGARGVHAGRRHRPSRAATPEPLDFSLVYCPTRKAMIESLNDWFERNDPDVIIGWNVIQFDLRVLQKTADDCGVQLLLGRERRPIEWRTHPGKQGYLFAPTPGRVIIDGIDALKAAVWSFPSFSLETVSQTLLGEGKSIGDAYDKMAEIERRYQQDKPALAVYNIRDCELVLRIFEKAKLLQFMMERAHATGLQADHFGGSIAAFSHHYLPRMHRLGYVAPSVGEIASKAYPGGYVMDSKPGFYDSVVVLDYKSLYPSIIRTFLVDPVGFVEARTQCRRQSDARQGPDGHLSSRARSIACRRS
jgi:DNA polymerase-2